MRSGFGSGKLSWGLDQSGPTRYIIILYISFKKSLYNLKQKLIFNWFRSTFSQIWPDLIKPLCYFLSLIPFCSIILLSRFMQQIHQGFLALGFPLCQMFASFSTCSYLPRYAHATFDKLARIVLYLFFLVTGGRVNSTISEKTKVNNFNIYSSKLTWWWTSVDSYIMKHGWDLWFLVLSWLVFMQYMGSIMLTPVQRRILFIMRHQRKKLDELSGQH